MQFRIRSWQIERENEGERREEEKEERGKEKKLIKK
jgi:hypothetical protein